MNAPRPKQTSFIWFFTLLALPALLFGSGTAQAGPRAQADPTAVPALTETPSLSPLYPTETPSLSPPYPTETPSLSPPYPTETPPATEPPAPNEEEGYVSLLVGLAPQASLRDLKRQTEFQAQDVGLARLNVYRFNVPAGQSQEAMRQLAALPGVAYVEPDGIVTGQDTLPNDPGLPFQYALVNIRAPQGWDISTGSNAITIAILDSGVDLPHPELAPKVLAGYDFVNGDADPQDDNGHGTHVAGIAAAASNNGIGIAGVSWGARILPVKVLDASNSGSYANVAAGIVWATDQGAQVINLSLGGGSPSTTLENAVNYAASRGVALVAAAGNTGGAILYPARYPSVIAVANTNAANIRVPSSAFGPEVDLSAPGAGIYSLAIGGGYTTLGGTSMAAPHVSGALALLLSLPGVNAGQARAYLEVSALDIDAPGWDIFTGSGLIQLDAALLLAIPPASSTPTLDSVARSTPTPTALVIFPFAASGGNSGLLTGTAAQFPPPVSPTPSQTATALLVSPTLTLTPSPTATFLPTAAPPGPVRFEWLPCLGATLLLLGLLLAAWAARQRRR